MGKKKKPGPKETTPVSVRVPVDLHARLEATAEALATDVSHLVRQLIAEFLVVFEQRAQQGKGTGHGG
jgi:hypothetical protein